MIDSKLESGKTAKSWQAVESRFQQIRKDSGVTLLYLQKECNLNHNTVKQIESAGNYAMSSLFKFFFYTNAMLKVDGKEVTTIEDLAAVLSEKREESGLKQREIMEQTGLAAKTIVSIEKGRGYNRNSFLKYIQLYHIDFDIDA